MRWLLAFAIVAGVVVLWLIFTNAKPTPDDSVTIWHNPSYEVEQQPGVINNGPCVWDGDDVQQIQSWDGHVESCLYADWATHAYRIILTGHKKLDLWVRVTADPPLVLVGDTEPTTEWYFDTELVVQKPYEMVSGCVTIDLSTASGNANQWQDVQGGTAVPTTLTWTFPEGAALAVHKRGVEDCP